MVNFYERNTDKTPISERSLKLKFRTRDFDLLETLISSSSIAQNTEKLFWVL